MNTAPTRGMRLLAARRLVGPTVSVISLVSVVWWALHQQAPHWPKGFSSLSLLLLCLFVYAGVTALRGLRWHVILRRAGVQASARETQAVIVVGYMGNTVLPARGGDLLRILLMGERTGCPRVTILGTIIAERLLDVLTLLVMCLLLALVGVGGISSVGRIGVVAAIALSVCVLVILAGWRWIGGGRPGSLRGHLAPLMLASRNLLGMQGGPLVLITALVWMGEGLVYWMVGRVLGIGMNIAQGSFLVALSSLAAAIPAAPGYAGTYDAAIQLGLRALHVGAGPALAFGVLVRLVVFAPITVIGLVLVVVRYGGLSSLARRRLADSSQRSTRSAQLAQVIK
jgi:glycosyltransferase 2 family protein